ncbi:hypothetical protein T01_377 [Trichinella spiralis]|uniref:Uncharacterized protein n=1 Tax=Trichinella spiralis TaxID=6334 RepID=A0A0V1ALH7_TRISP|nr:hypothetical protein T01_377 [Trichinella spiralis]
MQHPAILPGNHELIRVWGMFPTEQWILVKNTASSLSLYVSCIVSALAKLELTLDSEYMVHYRLSEEFTARVAVNNINDDQK